MKEKDYKLTPEDRKKLSEFGNISEEDVSRNIQNNMNDKRDTQIGKLARKIVREIGKEIDPVKKASYSCRVLIYFLMNYLPDEDEEKIMKELVAEAKKERQKNEYLRNGG